MAYHKHHSGYAVHSETIKDNIYIMHVSIVSSNLTDISVNNDKSVINEYQNVAELQKVAGKNSA